MKYNILTFIGGIVVFGAVLAAAWHLQSWVLLYIASALPVILVPLMPDIPRKQVIRRTGGKEQYAIRRQSGGHDDAGVLHIGFRPGSVNWNKTWLCVPLELIRNAEPYAGAAEEAVTLPVSAGDCRVTGGRRPMLRISLPSLSARAQALNYKTREVERLTLRLDELPQLALSLPVRRSRSAGQSRGAALPLN